MCCHIIVDAHAISYKMLNIIWQGFTRFKLVQSLQCLHFVPIVQNRIIELWGHEKVSSSPLDDNRPKLNPYWVLTPQILTQHQWKGKGVKPGAFPEPAISGCTTQEQTHRGQVNSSHSSISPQRGEHNSCLVWTAWPADLRVEQTVAQCGPVTRPERLNTTRGFHSSLLQQRGSMGLDESHSHRIKQWLRSCGDSWATVYPTYHLSRHAVTREASIAQQTPPKVKRHQRSGENTSVSLWFVEHRCPASCRGGCRFLYPFSSSLGRSHVGVLTEGVALPWIMSIINLTLPHIFRVWAKAISC